MINTYIWVLVLAFISGLTTIIGVVAAFYFKKNNKGIVAGIGFAIGIMLLVSFFELIPESINSAGTIMTLTAVIFGMLLIVFLDFLIPESCFTHSKGTFDKHLLKAAYCVAFCLILHDFPEGFAMATSFIHSPKMGLLLALAIAIHNIPEEFAMAVPLIAAGKGKKFLLKVGLISGLAEPAGAVLGLLMVSFLPKLNPLFMSFAAGAMIFVSIHELWPMARKYKNTHIFITGLVLSAVVYFSLLVLLPE